MHKRKILIIGNGGIAKTPEGSFCGDSNTGTFLCDLASKGYDITYCSHPGNRDQNKFNYQFNLDNHNIRNIALKGKRPWSYFTILHFLYLIFTHKHVYIFYPGGFSRLVARLCVLFSKKYGVYVRGHGLYKPKVSDTIIPTEHPFNDPFILEKADFLITVSDGLKAKLEKHNPSVSVIRPMISWSLDDVYHRNFAPRKKWSFLFVGSISELKGISDLIGIAKIFQAKNFSFELRIIGDGALYEHYKNEEQKGLIPAEVIFVGPVNEKSSLARYYETADALIFPSRNEGFPRVLYEAMLKSLPIFTTMVGGIPGVMKDHFNCIEIPVAEPEKQADIVLHSMQNSALLQKMAENALKTVRHILINRPKHHEALITNLK